MTQGEGCGWVMVIPPALSSNVIGCASLLIADGEQSQRASQPGWWGRSQGRVWRPTSRGRGGEWGWLSMIYPPIPTAWASRAMSSGAICECRHKIASTTPAQAQRHRRRRAPAGGGEIARRSMTRTLVPHPSRAILRSTQSLEAKSVSASVHSRRR